MMKNIKVEEHVRYSFLKGDTMSRKVKILWIIFSLLIISLLWIMANHDNLYGFDEKIFNLFNRFHNSTLDKIMYFFTSFGSSYILILCCLIILVLYDRRIGALASFNLLLSVAANLTLKAFFHRERPTWKLMEEFGFSLSWSF